MEIIGSGTSQKMAAFFNFPEFSPTSETETFLYQSE